MATAREEAPPLPDFIARQLPTGWDRFRLEVAGRLVHVAECGTGRPVLLLHGNPTWSFLYRKVAACLEGEGLRLVMPDLPGLGFSDRPPAREHTLESHGRWIGAVIDALELDEMILVAQDWGGPIGLLALSERASRLAGLVLLNTVVGPPRPGFRPTLFHRLARAPIASHVLFRLMGFPQNVLHRVQGDPGSIRGDVARAYRYPLGGLGRNAAPLALARMVPDSDHHPSIAPLRRSQALFEGFQGPIEIVWGERDPVLGRVLSHIERLRPDARVTRTAAGHFLQEEVPEAIAAAIRRAAAAGPSGLA